MTITPCRPRWAGTLTERERFNRQLHYQPVDRCFNMEFGVNCLFPYEVNACTHPADLLNEYGLDLRIMGGFDKIEMGKGREAIRAYMETLVPLVERGGYIPFCDHRCPPNLHPDDYLYYLDLKEQFFGMK